MDIASQIPLPWQTAQWQRLVAQLEADQLAHAYLLTGQAGLGKALLAQKLARRILCLTPRGEQACDGCSNCQLSIRGNHPDIHELHPEEAGRIRETIRVEQIRRLTDFVQKTSHAGGPKVAILHHAQQMNSSAANALLKTLEEPTPDTCLILVTEAAGSLSATIRSRCQRLLFHPPTLERASAWLERMLGKDSAPGSLLAAANNRPLLALELADKDNLSQRERFTEQICLLAQGRQPSQALVAEATKLGELTAIECLLDLSAALTRGLLLGGEQPPGSPVNPVLHGLARKLGESSQSNGKTRVQQLVGFYQSTLEAMQQLQSVANPNPQLVLESLLWQWKQIPWNPST